MKMQKKILIGVGLAFVALIVLALALPGSETETDTATDPVAISTAAPAVESTPAPIEEESQLEVEAEYLTESGLLIGESLEILDDYTIWLDEVSSEYELGVMYPDTSGGEAVLIRTQDVARRVESLDVPPTFEESHGYWMAANSEKIIGMELGIAGVELLDADLIAQGTAHFDESTRLIDEGTAALERAILGQ